MSLWNSEIRPMLAKSSKPFDSQEYLFEVKFDGTRAILFLDRKRKFVKIQNRRGFDITRRYPEFHSLWKNIENRAILDSEIVVLDEKGRPDFYRLQEREHSQGFRAELLSEEYPATCIVFDILHLNGQDLINLPLHQRKEILSSKVKEENNLLISRYVLGKGKRFFEESRKLGLEGVMAKKLDSPYLLGTRSKFWLKIKAFRTLDCIICGYTIGKGKRKKLGALILGCYHKGKLISVGKVGSGLEKKLLETLLPKLQPLRISKPPLQHPEPENGIWVRPSLVCEVKFMNLSRDLKLRAPVFLRLREDKNPEECELDMLQNSSNRM